MKPKPLFRFTVGGCCQQGLDILAESLDKTTAALGFDKFDWAVCYNALNKNGVDFLRHVIGKRAIHLVPQNWLDCPVDDECGSPKREDGSLEWNGKLCGGTLWKVCPARMRMETHEIVMDNDIVLLKKFSQIDEFLNKKDHALILEEPIRFYGRYNHLFPKEDKVFLNSGFMGMPPGYDFADEIRKTWEENKCFKNLSQADEQALLTYTLNKLPSVRVRKKQMKEVLARDRNTEITGTEEGIHFTQANRIPSHHSWQKYQELMNEG